MAKKSAIENNNKKKLMVAKYSKKRAALKKLIKSKDTSLEDRFAAVIKLSELPRNSSLSRVRNRCNLTGRPRGYLRYFGLSRIAVRDLASEALLPGVKKASW